MNPIRRAIALILLEDLDPFGGAMALLRKADTSDYHMLPLDSLTDQERDQADRLAARGLLRRLPASSRFPDRYAVTSGGSHALGTFKGTEMWKDFDGNSLERPRRRSVARLGKPASALATVGETLGRGDDWLALERAKLEAMSFKQLLSIVRWNDPNGAWSEAELEEYGTDHEMLVDQIMDWIADGMESPEEWSAGHDANHLGKPSYRGRPF